MNARIKDFSLDGKEKKIFPFFFSPSVGAKFASCNPVRKNKSSIAFPFYRCKHVLDARVSNARKKFHLRKETIRRKQDQAFSTLPSPLKADEHYHLS